MKIKEIKKFYVRETFDTPDKTPKILLENTQTKKSVEVLGKILEAQYLVNDSFLLLLTEGNPFEEALYIYYLNNSLEIIDCLELSAMYSEGMLRNLMINDSDKIQFSFFRNDESWILKILSTPKYNIWGNRYPVKRKSSIFHRSWLILKRS